LEDLVKTAPRGLHNEGVEGLLKGHIGSIPDFPIPGILFKDITPLLANGEAFATAVDSMTASVEDIDFDAILAVEARGFLFGAPIASRLRRGLILVRKPSKLPATIDSFDYTCEYCEGTLEVRAGQVRAGRRYLVLDDILATGGTARATADYVSRCRGTLVGYCFLIELAFLRGRDLLSDAPVRSVVVY